MIFSSSFLDEYLDDLTTTEETEPIKIPLNFSILDEKNGYLLIQHAPTVEGAMPTFREEKWVSKSEIISGDFKTAFYDASPSFLPD